MSETSVMEPAAGADRSFADLNLHITRKFGSSAGSFPVYFSVAESAGVIYGGTATTGVPEESRRVTREDGDDYEILGGTHRPIEDLANRYEIKAALSNMVIRVYKDNLLEGNETVTFTLLANEGDEESAYEIEGEAEWVVTIVDNPPPLLAPVVIEFAETAYTTAEGDTTNVVIRRAEGSGTAEVTFSILRTNSSGTNTSNEYTVDLSGLGDAATNTGNVRFSNLVLPAGSSSVIFPVHWPANPDTGTKSIRLALSGATSEVTATYSTTLVLIEVTHA